MESTQLFNKILFPTDFSKASMDALQYVIRLSASIKVELIILHTFRLTDSHLDEKMLFDSKKKFETLALNEFKIFDEQYLKNSGIKCLFLSEVGFISDRIVSNVKEHKIDLLTLDKTMQEKINEKSESDCRSIVQKMGCPLFLLPF